MPTSRPVLSSFLELLIYFVRDYKREIRSFFTLHYILIDERKAIFLYFLHVHVGLMCYKK